MSNFAGWLFVGAVLTWALQLLERIAPSDSKPQPDASCSSWARLLGPALYFSVLVFNISITFYIGETLLGLVDLLLFSALLVSVVSITVHKKNSFIFKADLHSTKIFR